MAPKTPLDYKKAIQASGFDIYHPVEVDDANFWIPTSHLETLLDHALSGLDLNGLALRTRSKAIKTVVCEALGYPVPKSFIKTQPRFPGQQLDTYAQKSNNLQIWNEELSPARRYAIIQISDRNIVLKVRVITGQYLALLDTTGTITTKYQAKLALRTSTLELVSDQDTSPLLPHTHLGVRFASSISPIDEPESGALMPIQEIFKRLSTLVGTSFTDPGMDQERNRGAVLHRMICECLGYCRYEDNGQFPDLRHQLLEVKLQTSPTIDLGLVLPSSTGYLNIRKIGDCRPRYRDTRYAIFHATTNNGQVILTHLFLTTGADFFRRFPRFKGKRINGKIQIPLPRNFFGR